MSFTARMSKITSDNIDRNAGPKRVQPPLFCLLDSGFGQFGFAVVLSQFLQLEDLSALDVAMTNKSYRQCWLRFIAGMGKLPEVDSYKHNGCSLSWFQSRGVRLSKLVMRKDVDELSADLFAEIPDVLSQLSDIYLDRAKDCHDYVDEQILTLLGEHCTELVTLVLQNCCEIGGKWEKGVRKCTSPKFAGLCTLFEGCKKLTTFSGMYCDTIAILESLATVETHLESITLSIFREKVPNDVLHRMIKQQPQLKKLDVEGFGYAGKHHLSLQETLNCIVLNCPNFEEIRIDGINDEVGWSPTAALVVTLH